MSRVRLSVVGALLAASAALAAGHARTGGGGVAADVRRPGMVSPAPRGEKGGGLEFRLSEGTESGAPPALVARPPAEPLPDADARRVLDRLPPLAALPREEPFAIRDGSLPPPRAGRSVRAAFPPAEEAARPDAAATGPLEVLRRMPEGDVPLAPHLSITFSQPMVALDSHAGLSREAVPARLSPQPPGEWRWVGTRTLVFEPVGRFPMATDYRVEIPAGTRAATGGTLASAASLVVLDSPAAARGPPPGAGPGAPRHADARGLRPARRPGGGRSPRCACAREEPTSPCASPPPPRWRRTRPSRGSRGPRSPAASSSSEPSASCPPTRPSPSRSAPAPRRPKARVAPPPSRTGDSAPTAPSGCGATSAGGAAGARPSTRGAWSSRTPSTRRRCARSSCASSPTCPASRSRPGATRWLCAAFPAAAPRTASASRARSGTPSVSRWSRDPRSSSRSARRRPRSSLPGATSWSWIPRAQGAFRCTRSTTSRCASRPTPWAPSTGRRGRRTGRRAGATRRRHPRAGA